MTEKYITMDETGTIEVATVFAASLNPGSVVALVGELGTGKTVFARGVAHALGIKEKITSPTFTLIHEYHSKKSELRIENSEVGATVPLYHIDLYRMNSIQEIRDIGIEEYLYGDGICLVEWAEKLGEFFPRNAIRITIKHLGNTNRDIEIERPQKS